MLRGTFLHRSLFVVSVWLFAAAIVVDATPAVAEEPLTGTLQIYNPRAVGLAGALRASPSGTSGIYLNPAVLAMTPIYHFELMYQYTGQEQMHSAGVSVVDSITSFIAAGLSFNYGGIRQTHSEHDAFDGRLALSGRLGERFFIGAAGRYIHVDSNTSMDAWGPGGVAALPASGSQQADGFTFDVGAALRAGEFFTLGVVGYNLTNTGSIYAPIKLGGGGSVYLLDMLLVEVNGVADFTSHDASAWEIRMGTELFIAKRVGLRAGYYYDIYYDIHSICAGLGYVDTRFSLDFGFMQEAVDSGRTVLAFSFKYFVN